MNEPELDGGGGDGGPTSRSRLGEEVVEVFLLQAGPRGPGGLLLWGLLLGGLLLGGLAGQLHRPQDCERAQMSLEHAPLR